MTRSTKRHTRFGLWLALLLLLLVISPAAQNVPLTQISSDPFTNPTSQHATEVEPDTFAFGSTIVAAFQAGRYFNGGASDIGFATSTNGGATWTHGFLPITTVAGGPRERASDPSVAYDAKHGVWLIAAIPTEAVSTPGQAGVIVSRSTDGGFTWSGPITVATIPTELNPSVGVGSLLGFFDKVWIVCDDTSTSTFYGHCYTEWNDVPSGHPEMSTSSDGGLTWGAVNTPANSVPGWGGQPVVQPNGTVIVPCAGGFPGASPQTHTIEVFRSEDGGATWSTMTPVSVIRSHTVAGGLRGGNVAQPSAEIDAAGKVYVAWQDCRFRRTCSSNDIVFSTSTDGLNWSPVTRVPIDDVTSTVDHFIPGLAVDRSTSSASAHLGLAYYYYPEADCDFATCQLDFGFVSSVNGGASWSAPTQLAGPMSLNWLADTSSGRMVGDYISTSFTADGTAHPVFAVANAPSGGLFDEAMYTPASGLIAVGGSAVASSEGMVFTGATPQSPPGPDY